MSRILLFFTGIVLVCTVKVNAQWVILNPKPTFLDISSASFPSGNAGYITDIAGTIFKTINGGSDWEEFPGPAREIVAIDFINTSNGICISSDSVFVTQDGGETWMWRLKDAENRLRSIARVDNNLVFIFGEQGCIIRSEDGGMHWYYLNFPDQSILIKKIKFFDKDHGFCLAEKTGNEAMLYRTGNGGTSWDQIPIPAAVEVLCTFDALSQNIIWISDGPYYNNYSDTTITVYHSNDGGVNWVAKDIGSKQGSMRPADIQFISPMDGRLIINSLLCKTSDGGENWTEINLGDIYSGPISLIGQKWKGTQNGCFFGQGPCLLRTTDGASSFTQMIKGGIESYWEIWFSDFSHGCVLGPTWPGKAPASISRYTEDGGVTWIQSTVDTLNPAVMDMDFGTATHGWAPYGNGIYKTTDGGRSWSSIPFSVNSTAFKVSAVDSLNVFAAGDRFLIKSSDGGITWTKSSIPGIDGSTWDINQIKFTDVLTGYVTSRTSSSNEGWLYKTSDGGITWKTLNYGNSYRVSKMSFADSLNGSVIVHGFEDVLLTNDGGLTWREADFNAEEVQMISPDTLGIWYSLGWVGISYDGGRTVKMLFEDKENMYRTGTPVFFLDEKHIYSCGSNGMIIYMGDILTAMEELDGYPWINLSGDPFFFPNPAQNTITITEEGFSKLSIYDLNGSFVWSVSISRGSEVNISSLPAGIYIVNATGTKDKVSCKLVKF